MNDFFLKENTNFIPFTSQHLWLVFLIVCFGCLLILWTKKQQKNTQIKVGNIVAFSISISVIFGTFLKIYRGDFNYQEDLPLHLCSFLALIIPVLSTTRKFLYYEIFYFLILGGTLQSLITPDEKNYLNFKIFRYWLVNAGLVFFMMYATFIYNMRTTLKSVWKSFIAMQVYMLLMFVLNYFLGSNYFFTNKKPDAETLLDVFGDWPQYVFVVELFVIPYFLLLYLPFYLTRKKN